MSTELILITLGGLLLAGLAMDELGRRTRMPRVTLLVLCGILVGPSGLDLLPDEARAWFGLVSVMALVMVAFLLGGRLTRGNLARDGAPILGVSAGVVVCTLVLVSGGLYLAGADPVLSLILGGIATATAPAATQDVVAQRGYDRTFSRTLLGVVAIDDAWGLIAFSLILALAHAMIGQSAAQVLLIGARELLGAVGIGLAVGLPAAYLTGRLQPGEPSQAEALGVVFICGGLALTVQTSFLLATMTAGLVIANTARHHARPFHEIEHIEWPFMIVFFILAGASLDIAMLPSIGMVGGLYVVLRVIGRVVGGWLGGAATGMVPVHRRWIGAALMPQAGIAMGMALVAAESFPDLADRILVIAVGTTVLFELVGPIVTQLALVRVTRATGDES
ncbi:MAG: cation:proton antiporter [Alphaproteobacteria bacterium]